MVYASFFIFLFITFLIGLFFWAFMRRRAHLEVIYRRSLETHQKKLDRQTSRLNILSRALPNLRKLIADPNQGVETWKALCLDEARALIWADGASYWKFLEKPNELEREIGQGTDAKSGGLSKRTATESTSLGKSSQTRLPVCVEESGFSVLVVPLVVSGHLWGLFRFVRNRDNPINQKDADIVTMFISQLAVALENRELILNREKFYLELVQTLADTLDSRDASSKGQSRRARELARGVARELDLPDEFIYYLEFAALMHDIGKIAIDENLLKKPGKLSPQEYEIVKKHPEFGHRILAPVSLLAPVAPMVLYHQEWFNGKGYPEGLSGEEIPLGARIVAVLDAWGAMTSDRPWRRSLRPQECIKELKKGAGSQFDPNVVEAFIATVKNQGLLDKK